MRASVAKWTAKGEVARSRTVTQATRRPPSRRPASQATGRVATAISPDSERTAWFPVPVRRIQEWRRT